MTLRPVARGFTLIELLVVVAVIAVLAAILLPLFAQAREAARGASCLSNQRQVGAAVQLYVQDFDEQFPQTHPTATPWTFPDDEITLVTPWRTLLEPYVRNQGLFRCPSDWGTPSWHPTSYAPNGYTVYGLSLASLSRPSEFVYVTELQPGALVDDFSPWNGPEELVDTLATTRHSGTAAYLYADGHVKRLSFAATQAPTNLFVP